MKVREIQEALKSYDDEDEVDISVIGYKKNATFQDIKISRRGDQVFFTVPANDDPEGIIDLSLDLLKREYHPFRIGKKRTAV
jgi:hypothetical protein